MPGDHLALGPAMIDHSSAAWKSVLRKSVMAYMGSGSAKMSVVMYQSGSSWMEGNAAYFTNMQAELQEGRWQS